MAGELGLTVHAAKSPGELLGCDIICTATSSATTRIAPIGPVVFPPLAPLDPPTTGPRSIKASTTRSPPRCSTPWSPGGWRGAIAPMNSGAG